MRRHTVFAALCVLFVSAAGAAETVYEATWRDADTRQRLPLDLVDPAGKTEWDLTAIFPADVSVRRVERLDDGTLRVVSTREQEASSVTYGVGAGAWWLPHLDAARHGRPVEFVETVDGSAKTVRVTTRRLGNGWVRLPDGPREVVVEAARWTSPGDDRLVYRWVDPRAGAVAEVWGRPDAAGRAIAQVEGAATLESLAQGGLPLKVYSDGFTQPPYSKLVLGYDRFGTCTVGLNSCVSNDDCTAGGGDKCTIPISEVTTVAHGNAAALIAASSWDFTPTQLADARYEIGSTTADINSAETCNFNQCGFSTNLTMGREDKNFTNPADAFITLSATETEQRAGDVTIWLRAGVRLEGRSGGLGEGESRFCYEGIDTNGDTRPDIPLWRFANQDAGGWYMQTGDSWTNSAPFSCEQSLFNHVCPNSCGLFCPLWVQGCTGAPDEGTQGSVVIGEGVLTSPSGHDLNVLLIRQVVDFCVYLGNTCGLEVERVHQVIYLFVAPGIGTVARLMSEQNEPDDTSFDDLMEADIKYGLFPPRAISATGATDTSISISWDPGTITHHIDGYKIYWDTDSGSSSAYAFNSVDNAAQVSLVGTTATISGLDPGTDYYVTVTALSDYANPSTGVSMTYESLLFPTTTSGAGGPLPPELTAMTTGGSCTPTLPVSPCDPMGDASCLTVDKAPGGIEICWVAPADPCVEGYTILGAATPEAAVNFTPIVPDTGPVTCETLNPTDAYFLTIGNGGGGSGPWGHFNQ